jgi:hypothetical protein
MIYQVTALKDKMAEALEAAGCPSRGWAAAYRISGGEWKLCRENHGAGGMMTVWKNTPEAAKSAAKEWLKKRAKVRNQGAVTA